MRLKQNLLCFLCRSLSFLVKLEQLDLGGNDLEVLVRRGQGRGAGPGGGGVGRGGAGSLYLSPFPLCSAA